jgi:hypothetical protein
MLAKPGYRKRCQNPKPDPVLPTCAPLRGAILIDWLTVRSRWPLAGLMLGLFALGVMSLFWMAVVAAAILVEKTLPGGEAFARLLAVAFSALGIWVAASPSSVPGLTQPSQTPMQMPR